MHMHMCYICSMLAGRTTRSWWLNTDVARRLKLPGQPRLFSAFPIVGGGGGAGPSVRCSRKFLVFRLHSSHRLSNSPFLFQSLPRFNLNQSKSNISSFFLTPSGSAVEPGSPPSPMRSPPILELYRRGFVRLQRLRSSPLAIKEERNERTLCTSRY